jgi:transposase
MSAKANTRGGARMGYMRGEGRNPMYLLPETIDADIGAENPVRFLDAFVEQIEREQGGLVRATAAAPGRPGDAPGDLWRFELYGDLNRMRSRRRWAREAARKLELMWRLGTLRPAGKLLADFRRDHGAAPKQVCREGTLLGNALALCGGELIAMDGSKFQAVNGKQRHCSARQRVRLIAADRQQLDRDDAEETPPRTPTAAPMPQTLEQWQARQQRDRCDQQPLQQRGATQRARTEPASRQRTRGDSSLGGYTV